jgi:dTDP-4-dehydrorhamnose 3,5-epimerase
VRCVTPGEKKLIAGVKVRRLPAFPDERGVLTEILRADDPEYPEFGQIYMTTTYPGVVKGWHYHEHQTDMVCCISGELKLVLYDGRTDSPTSGLVNELFLGDSNRLVVKIPKGVHHGWKCVGEDTALVLNMPDRAYHYDFPYDWRRRDG